MRVKIVVCLAAVMFTAACAKSKSLIASEATTTVASGPLTLSLASAPVISGNTVMLAPTVGGITIVKPDGDTSGKTGHFHVFIDKDPVATGEVIPHAPGIIHTADNPILVTGLTDGPHHIAVVLGDGAHHRLGTVEADANVTISGPTVSATAPAIVPSGQPAVITVAVEGVTLVKPDGDTTGKTGHLHLFIDRDPTPAGQPIPHEDGIIHTADTTVSIPNLKPGEHVVWVVLGDGAHNPFAPPAEAKVTFAVS